jgi:hypothetical protein
VKIPVEVGGGLRVLEIAMRYRDRGADRVVFGTAAIADPGVGPGGGAAVAGVGGGWRSTPATARSRSRAGRRSRASTRWSSRGR